MPVWKVQQIYDISSTTKFYENLEEYIKERILHITSLYQTFNTNCIFY